MEPIKREMQAADWNVGTPFGSAANNPGGFNFLDIPDDLYQKNKDQFFEMYNRPWLDTAIRRGDEIVIATPPGSRGNLISAAGELKGSYAKELHYLVQMNHKPTNLSDVEWNTLRSWFR
jgi:hypothetical protein